ncbi:MAG: hypothetical protein M3Z03_03660 [Actinomycetota bacterium]|nr:hypothetical protein [Actinomycetota bacterium]
MLVRAAIGFVLLAGFVALGAWINDRRRSGQPWLRAAAGKAHWGVGVMALGALALLLVGALTYVLG